MHRTIRRALLLFAALGALSGMSSRAADGARSFETHCAICHGGDGGGSERAPGLRAFVSTHADPDIADLIRHGRRAMPAHDLEDAEMVPLLSFLHTLQTGAPAPRETSLTLIDGGTLAGRVLNETALDLQLQTADGMIHRLDKAAGRYRPKALEPKADWVRYDGQYSSNRYSPITQINAANASHLHLAWMFPVPGAPRLEATPIVEDGIMYVSSVNAAYALDASNGRKLWSYSRPATSGLLGEAAGGANRGLAIADERLLMLTDNAHLLALGKARGELLWDVAITDWPRSQYSATGAPLVIGEHVLVGVAGGEEGARGFIASYEAQTGREEWRKWTIPLPGEPLAASWRGTALTHGCGATWMSGSYDPTLKTVYWAVGNPCPDYNGEDRQGDNLYTDSVLALDPDTGTLKWFYQFTPHDTQDWDAAEPLMLIDTIYEHRPRQLLVQANRNGFLFVLDRTNGKFLRATPFVERLTWASGYTPRGKPIRLAPQADGSVCPASATNWMAASFDPSLDLLFVSAFERCKISTPRSDPFEMGRRYFSGTVRMIPGGSHVVRAIDLQTGRTAWSYMQAGPGMSSSGTLATAGGLVFAGEDSGLFTAVNAKTGEAVWHFTTNDNFRASPMTYLLAGRQYVCIATSTSFLAFALDE